MEYNSLLLEASAVKGLKEEEFVRRGCRITHGLLPSGGEYYTLTERGDAPLVKLLSDYIKKLAGDDTDRILIVGLGNRGMTADALGNTVLSRLNAGGKPYFCLIAPQVSVTTGVESAEIIACISERVRALRTLGQMLSAGQLPACAGERRGQRQDFADKNKNSFLGRAVGDKAGRPGRGSPERPRGHPRRYRRAGRRLRRKYRKSDKYGVRKIAYLPLSLTVFFTARYNNIYIFLSEAVCVATF